LENKKKVATNFPRNALKRKNKVEEGGASGWGVKNEQESTNLRAHKWVISDHGNCEFEYGEFDFGSKHLKRLATREKEKAML
jgi:hypothetical protein